MSSSEKEGTGASLIVAVVSLLISLFTFAMTFIVHDEALVTISPLAVEPIQPTPQTWAYAVSFNLAAMAPGTDPQYSLASFSI